MSTNELDGDNLHHIKETTSKPTEVIASKTSLTELYNDEKNLQYELNRVNSAMFKMKDRGYRFVILKDGRVGWINNGL